MVRMADYDIKIEAVVSGTTYSTETGAVADTIRFKSINIKKEKNKPMKADIVLARNDVAVTFNPWDEFEVFVKDPAEATWNSRFWGFVEEVSRSSETDEITIKCSGMAEKWNMHRVLYKVYANTFIDHQEYTASTTVNEGIFVQLSQVPSGNCDPQVPLVACEVLDCKEGAFAGILTTGLPIGDPSGATFHAVAMVIVVPSWDAGDNRKSPGKNPKLYLQFKRALLTGASGDIVIELGSYGYASFDCQATNGINWLASYTVSASLLTTSWQWFELPFPIQLKEGASYVIRISTTQFGDVVTGHSVRAFDGYGYPKRRPVMTSIDTFVTWSQDISVDALMFIYSDEAHWKSIEEDKEYLVDPSSQKVWFRRMVNDAEVDGKVGVGAFWGVGPMMLNWLPSFPVARITYLKGTLNFTSALTDYINDWLTQVVDTSSIEVGTHILTFGGVILENDSLLAGLMEFLKGSPTVWYIKESGGERVLVIEPELTADAFLSYASGVQDIHTFWHGLDATADGSEDDFVRLITSEMVKNISLQRSGFNIRTPQGGTPASKSDMSVSPGGFLIRLGGGSIGDGIGASDRLDSLLGRAAQVVAKVSVVDVDMSTSSNIFNNPNEAVNLKDSRVGLNNNMAVRAFSIDISEQGIIISMYTESYTEVYWIDTVVPDGVDEESKIDMITNMRKVINDSLLDGFGGYGMKGNTTCNAPRPKGGGPADRANDSLYASSTSFSFNPDELGTGSTYWFIEVGIGTPSAGGCGTPLTMVLAGWEYVSSSASVILYTKISDDEFLSAPVYPATITEIAVYVHNDPDPNNGVPAIVSAKTVGKGSTIDEPQPVLYKRGRVSIAVKMTG